MQAKKRVSRQTLLIRAAIVLIAVGVFATPVRSATAAEPDATPSPASESTFDYGPPIEQMQSLIYGGGDVINPGYIVALFRNDLYICTGSLVDSQVVLVAAHCVDEPGNYSILAGEEYLYASGIRRTVTAIHINPGWGGNFDDVDLALVALNSPVTTLPTAILNTTGLWPEWTQTLVVAGWGQTYGGSPPASYLQAAGVFATSGMDGTYDPFYCNVNPAAMKVGGVFCFGGPVAAGVCAGDSGGPLVGWPTPTSTSGTLVLYGLVSYGPPGCGPATYDDVAQSVGGHYTWIQSVIDEINNVAPIANNDGPYAVDWDNSISIPSPGVLGNDIDTQGSGLTATIVSTPGHGTVSLNANGSFVYTHNGTTGDGGTDGFTYQARGANGVLSNIATVSITIGADPEPFPVHLTGLVDPSQGKWHLYDVWGNLTTSFFYGNPGDYPIMGDWDGDGIETPGMYRQSDGYVYLRNSNTQGIAHIRFFFGDPGDIPIAGDFNGNGFDTVSIYRPSNQTFYIINELGKNDGGLGPADFSYVFGNPGDKPYVGDFNGNGQETVGLHRETTGLVYYRNSHSTGNADNQFLFGDPGDRLVAGDWTGNGVFTPALFRPMNTTMFFRFTNSQGNANIQFIPSPTNSTWLPVSGIF